MGSQTPLCPVPITPNPGLLIEATLRQRGFH